MPTIRRSPRAAGDLIELWTHIAVDDPAAADRMLDLGAVSRTLAGWRWPFGIRLSSQLFPVPLALGGGHGVEGSGVGGGDH